MYILIIIAKMSTVTILLYMFIDIQGHTIESSNFDMILNS